MSKWKAKHRYQRKPHAIEQAFKRTIAVSSPLEITQAATSPDKRKPLTWAERQALRQAASNRLRGKR